jgi:hypothetical protein
VERYLAASQELEKPGGREKEARVREDLEILYTTEASVTVEAIGGEITIDSCGKWNVHRRDNPDRDRARPKRPLTRVSARSIVLGSTLQNRAAACRTRTTSGPAIEAAETSAVLEPSPRSAGARETARVGD